MPHEIHAADFILESNTFLIPMIHIAYPLSSWATLNELGYVKQNVQPFFFLLKEILSLFSEEIIIFAIKNELILILSHNAHKLKQPSEWDTLLTVPFN